MNNAPQTARGHDGPRSSSDDSELLATDWPLSPEDRVRSVRFSPQLSTFVAYNWIQTEGEQDFTTPQIVDFLPTSLLPTLVFGNCRFSFNSILLLIGLFLPHGWLALVGSVVLAELVGKCCRESFWILGPYRP